MNTEQWGTPLALDPGQHNIEAIAPGKEPWKTTVNVLAIGQTVTIVVPALAKAVALLAPAPNAIAPGAIGNGSAAVPIGNQPSEPTRDRGGYGFDQRIA